MYRIPIVTSPTKAGHLGRIVTDHEHRYRAFIGYSHADEARTLAAEARAILAQTMADDTWQVGAAKSAEGEALIRLRR